MKSDEKPAAMSACAFFSSRTFQLMKSTISGWSMSRQTIFAARRVVPPLFALEHGDIVIQDRSYYSTLAYQYPGLNDEAWRELERIERTLALEPDLILYLDAPVDVAVKRVEQRGQRDPFEDEPYLNKVKWKFEQMFQPPKWVRIDATGSPERTLEQAMNALMAAGL